MELCRLRRAGLGPGGAIDPVLELGDFPDPFVLHDGPGRFVVYATNAAGSNVQAAFSADLMSWRRLPDALPRLPAWARPGRTWAPAAAAIGGVYVLWYTAHHAATSRQAISVATAARAEGPFVDRSDAPLVFQEELGGSIDPSPFVDADGRRYLTWKADANALGGRASLWIQALTADGHQLVGEAVRLLGIDARWEEPLVEAPSIVAAEGRYYLFYSANWYNTDHYGIGYAIADAVTGPYTKVTTTGAWTGSGTVAAGPGGQEWFDDDHGNLMMAAHAWAPGRVGYPAGARRLHLARVRFEAGSPVVVDGTSPTAAGQSTGAGRPPNALGWLRRTFGPGT